MDFDQVELYDTVYSSDARKDGLKLISLLAPQQGDKVIHLGCATGYLTKLLADTVGPEGKVVGVDPDLDRLQLARDRYPASNLEYLQGTAEDIPTEDNGFDIIFSTYMLHWCKDIDSVFKAGAAKLKPMGKFGFVAFTDELSKHLIPENMFSEEFRSAFESSIHPIDISVLEHSAARHNLKVVVVKEHFLEKKFMSVSELITYYRTHFHNRFDEMHFNSEAMKRHYGEGEFCIKIDMVTSVLELVVDPQD